MKALMKYTGSEDPVFNNPFTVVDPQGVPWTIATDRVWFVAVKNQRSGPRFRGDFSSLGVVLKLIAMVPKEPLTFDREEALGRLEPEGIGCVLGVPVSLKRLHTLLHNLPGKTLSAWNSSYDLGVPGLGIFCEGWQTFLIGFEGADDVKAFSLASPEATAFDLAMSLEDD